MVKCTRLERERRECWVMGKLGNISLLRGFSSRNNTILYSSRERSKGRRLYKSLRDNNTTWLWIQMDTFTLGDMEVSFRSESPFRSRIFSCTTAHDGMRIVQDWVDSDWEFKWTSCRLLNYLLSLDKTFSRDVARLRAEVRTTCSSTIKE